jgi:predicted nucleotidyltransferase
MELVTRCHRLDEEARARLREQLTRELATHADVAFAYLYGSFVESDVFHDVDVGVYFSPPPPIGARASALAQSLSDRAKLPVDVRPLNGAPVSFVYHVLRGHLLLSRDDALLAEVMERTVRQYLDIAPLLRHSTKEAFAP